MTVAAAELGAHTHQWRATNTPATSNSPQNKAPAIALGDVYTTDFTAENMASQAISNTGGSQSHTNMHPFLCLRFIVALFGIYPSRN